MENKICKVCDKHFSLDDNKLGIVLDDEFFICEKCYEIHDDFEQIVPSISHSLPKKMPIALWLIQEQNKDKHFMSIKR